MSEFITTKGISYHIEEIVKKAAKEITFVTPYLKIAPLLLERIMEHDRKGLYTTIIYGKDELRSEQRRALSNISNLNLYFAKNLHAKCYYNESQLLITSMNLHEFSENNNREFGVVVDARKEKSLYNEVLKEVESIKASAILQKQTFKTREEVTQQTSYKKYDYKELVAELFNALSTKYPYANFRIQDGAFHADSILGLNANLSNKYGFATLELHDNSHKRNHTLKDIHYGNIIQEMKSYRVFWSSPFNQISLYHQKGIEFMDIYDDVRYCLFGIESLISCMRKFKIISAASF